MSVSRTFKLPSGEKIPLYYIGELAYQLGRTSQLVRKWEVAGAIPCTFFKDKTGKRLYSQEQIDIIVKYAEKCKLRQGYPISRTSFSKWVHADMKELQKKYLKKGVSY